MTVNKKAFTLIELLVVIAIIGTLSSLLLPNYMNARERARDAQRKSDLKQLQKALELYRQDKNAYPPPYISADAGSWFNDGGNCGKELTNATTGVIYLNRIPCDPLGPTPYAYNSPRETGNTYSYAICGCLENKADPETKGLAACASACKSSLNCKSAVCYYLIEP